MPYKKSIDKVLDVRGLLCPAPTVMSGKTLREMKKGKTLRIITNDVTAKETIPALCNQEGYHLLELKEEEGLLNFIVRK